MIDKTLYKAITSYVAGTKKKKRFVPGVTPVPVSGKVFDEKELVNGVEAVLNFIRKRYDFVLLDLRMPRLSGTDALRIMKDINPSVPAIAFSGNAGSSEMAETLQCGAIKCFSKPFAIAQLKEDIKNSL